MILVLLLRLWPTCTVSVPEPAGALLQPVPVSEPKPRQTHAASRQAARHFRLRDKGASTLETLGELHAANSFGERRILVLLL
jgi:hypothetical protein